MAASSTGAATGCQSPCPVMVLPFSGSEKAGLLLRLQTSEAQRGANGPHPSLFSVAVVKTTTVGRDGLRWPAVPGHGAYVAQTHLPRDGYLGQPEPSHVGHWSALSSPSAEVSLSRAGLPSAADLPHRSCCLTRFSVGFKTHNNRSLSA